MYSSEEVRVGVEFQAPQHLFGRFSQMGWRDPHPGRRLPKPSLVGRDRKTCRLWRSASGTENTASSQPSAGPRACAGRSGGHPSRRMASACSDNS
jgi:hypothetical protein